MKYVNFFKGSLIFSINSLLWLVNELSKDRFQDLEVIGILIVK